MAISFYKYQGTGNDFIMIDNREGLVQRNNQALFAAWCDRRFGIGADGVILLQTNKDFDFEMIYINADGREGSMCGNGGRCVVQFAHDLGLIKDSTTFLAVDGEHAANLSNGQVQLAMQDTAFPTMGPDGGYFLNTGSPHHLAWVSEVALFDVAGIGKKLRWHAHYAPGGTNVNFLERAGDRALKVRTYERGVEAETFSCGTGVTAAALLMAYEENWQSTFKVVVHTSGGTLQVQGRRGDTGFDTISLIGPAQRVFTGLI